MKTISIDPGYDRIGVAILEKETNKKESLVFSTCIMTDKKNSIHERIFKACEDIEKIIKTYKPERFAIEQLFHTNNTKTVMGVSEARGAFMYLAHKHNLLVNEYTPSQIKNATTGYGKATKPQVYDMVRKLISLPKEVKQDDEIDAIAVGITDLAHTRI